MKLLIDDADIEKIKRVYQYYAIDGVTTNPSILAKTGRNPYEVLTEIRNLLGENAELHVQVVSEKAEDMIEEGHMIAKKLGKNTYIKIPTVPEGLKAMRILHEEGYNITATAIYTPLQGYLAAKAGANYTAPYVNRIDNLGTNGIEVTRKIHDIFKNNNFKTEILAASFKNSLQVLELCEYGVGAATVAPEIIEGFINNTTNVSAAVKDFTDDFEKLCGKGKTMLNCD